MQHNEDTSGTQANRQLRVCHVAALDTSLSLLMLPLMRLQRDAGYEVAAVAGVDPGAEPDQRIADDGFAFHRVTVNRSMLSMRHFASIREYVRVFRREQFDVVHVHTPIAAFLARIAARIARTPLVVYTVHGLYFDDRTAQPSRSLAIGAEWLSGRFTDLLMSQSAEDAATVQRLHLSRGPVVTIGNGVDPESFFPDEQVRARVRQELGVPNDRPVVLIVGRLVEEKGYLELFDSFRMLDTEAELWIVGISLTNRSGRDVAGRMNEAIEQAHPDRKVRYLGERDGVADFMRAADVFILPSYREGMPRSVLEAMMTGLPVIASNIRGSREEVVAGETGLLCEVGDVEALTQALAELLGDPQRRKTMGDKGRQRALDLYVESHCLSRQMDAIDTLIRDRKK